MRITASKTKLLFACGYSFRADVTIPHELERSRASELGTEFHSGIEAVLTGERPPSSPAEMTAALWLSAARAGLGGAAHAGLFVEAAFAWNPATGEAMFLGRGRNAYAAAPEGWLCGTADWILVYERAGKKVAFLGDWKTGEHGAFHAGPQLWTLGVLVSAALELDEIRVVSMHVDLDNGAVTTVLDETLSDFDLMLHRAALREALDAIPGAQPVLGEHCAGGFCDAGGVCPARAALVERATPELVQMGRNPLTAPITCAADAAALIEALPHVEAYAERRKKEAHEWIKQNVGDEMRVSDTHVLRKITSKRTTINAAQALVLAKRLGATEADEASCTRTTAFSYFKRIPSSKKDTAA